jgi:hypothetical protein
MKSCSFEVFYTQNYTTTLLTNTNTGQASDKIIPITEVYAVSCFIQQTCEHQQRYVFNNTVSNKLHGL